MKKKLLLSICLLCLFTKPTFAYTEFEKKIYKSFDGKTFESEKEVLEYEKIQSIVNTILQPLKNEIQDAIKTRNNSGFGFYCDPLAGKYDKYELVLYECFKTLNRMKYKFKIIIEKEN